VKTDEWAIVGKVRKPLLLEKNVVDFGDVSNLEEQVERTLRVQCLAPVASFAASCDPRNAGVDVIAPGDASGRCSLRVSLSQELPLGRFDFELNLVPASSGDEQLPALPVRVTGRIAEDIQVVPSEVTFGAVRIGESASETVTLRSLTGRPFTFQAAETSIDGVTVVSSSQAGEPTACRVALRPVQTGAKAGSVRFQLSSGGRSIIVPLRMSYVGLAPTNTATRHSTHEQHGILGS
jgi:hypothetical protein